MAAKIDRRLINRHLRTRNVLVLTLVFFTAVIGFIGVNNVIDLSRDLTASYVSTTGQVIVEETRPVREGSRRNRHWVDRRFVTIEYSLEGKIGSDSVRSDDLQVGESLPIWVETRDGDVRTEAPAGPDFWQWFWAVTMTLLTLLIVWWLVAAVRTSVRLLAFSPEKREPDFVFALQGITQVPGAKKPTLKLSGVMEANSIEKRVGERTELTVRTSNAPQAQTYPPRFTGYYVNPGAASVTVVLHAVELDAWFAADLTYPAELEAIAQGKVKPEAGA